MIPTVDDPYPDLVKSLRGPNAEQRSRSARSLGRLGWLARDALPLLAGALQDRDPAVREAAAQAVGQMGPDALPHLGTMLTHPDKYVRRNAVWALGKLGPLARTALAALCEALKDEDPRTASGAAQALGSVGADAGEAVPALTEAMRGTNIVLCRLAAKALSQIGRAALPALMTHLRHRDPFVRGEAALALGWMGPMAETAVPGLIEALRCGRPVAHRHTGGLLTLTMEPATPPTGIAPAGTDAPTPEATSRAYAAQALGRIGPAAATARAALRECEADPCESVRQSAQQALRLILG